MDVAAFARKTIENHWFVQWFCYQNHRISWVFAGFARTLEIHWFSLIFLGWRSQTIVKPYQNHTKTIKIMVLAWFWYGFNSGPMKT